MATYCFCEPGIHVDGTRATYLVTPVCLCTHVVSVCLCTHVRACAQRVRARVCMQRILAAVRVHVGIGLCDWDSSNTVRVCLRLDVRAYVCACRINR